MAVDVNICNDALNFLGVEPVASLDDDSKAARTCKAQYPIARDYILRTHPWNFALKRDILTPIPDAPTFGDTTVFLLPQDCVRVNKVLDDNGNPIRYKTEGRRIYATESDHLNLSYVSNSVPEGDYDVAFRRAVAAHLAGDICYKMTQSANLMQGMYALAENIARESRTLDSMENTPDNFKFDYFDKARVTTHEIYPESDVF